VLKCRINGKHCDHSSHLHPRHSAGDARPVMDFGPHCGPASLPHEGSATARALTVEAGASLAKLMNRMGRFSTGAARVYLHAREERDRQLATTLDKMARRELRRSSSGQSHAAGTRASQGITTGN
jgi:hypothetical protein